MKNEQGLEMYPPKEWAEKFGRLYRFVPDNEESKRRIMGLLYYRRWVPRPNKSEENQEIVNSLKSESNLL